jgi:L-fuculose-phosphate aldolase
MFGYRKNIVMVDNRCVIVTGASLLNAFDRTEVLEYGAASLLAAHALGSPIALSEAEIKHTNQVLGL